MNGVAAQFRTKLFDFGLCSIAFCSAALNKIIQMTRFSAFESYHVSTFTSHIDSAST
jgi:hypothetical protein